MHTPGAQVSKCVHPATKMCTSGAGCTLNFEHCLRTLAKNIPICVSVKVQSHFKNILVNTFLKHFAARIVIEEVVMQRLFCHYDLVRLRVIQPIT